MNEPKVRELDKIRDKLAEKRSKRQCSSGNPDLDRAISWYLKIGFEDGFNAAVELLQNENEELKKAYSDLKKQISVDFMFEENQSLKEALELAVKGLEYISAYNKNDGKAPHDNKGPESMAYWHWQESISRNVADKTLAAIEAKTQSTSEETNG